MYIPIAFISSINGKKVGIIHAIISALLVGPFMPLDVSLNLSQEPVNWITRLIIYGTISLIIGFFADYNKRNQEYITDLLTYDMVTDFKNIESLKKEDNFNNDPKIIIALSVREYKEILSFFGYNFTNRATFKIAEKLKEVLSNYNNIDLYRYGGMEFILIITQNSEYTNIDEIISDLESLNKSTIRVDTIPIYIEIVMGMTKINGDISLLEGTRQALLSLRYAIDNHIKFNLYNKSVDIHYRNVINIASNFTNALANNHIKVAYQNIYHSGTNEIYGIEMLSRWINEDNEQIYPNDFIPIIEQTELINELSKYMIDRAIEKLLSDNNQNIISINLSPKDFKEEVINYLMEKMQANNINPKQLQLEITEAVLINKDDAVCYLELIRNHGVSIAIDDFGTGYSSYQYISELPIDVIKIDKSIIGKVDESPFSRSIVKSIVDFCKTNNFKTIAEGVETKEIVDACTELDIDLLQGYYYHKPILIE